MNKLMMAISTAFLAGCLVTGATGAQADTAPHRPVDHTMDLYAQIADIDCLPGQSPTPEMRAQSTGATFLSGSRDNVRRASPK